MDKIRTLIVEDEAISAMLLESELKSWGHCVLDILSTGRAAIEKAIELKPDLILMDIYLGDDIDGIKAVTEIHKTNKIPIIYITASADQETLNRIDKTEFKQVIQKPYNSENLKNAIQTCMR